MVIEVRQLVALLPRIFPEGTPHRGYVIREMAAKTIFVMLYTGAIEGSDRWFRPAQLTLMSDAQAARISAAARVKWAGDSLVNGRLRNPAKRWYATNSREPIRDETLRNGLVPLGAVIERAGLPTTSGKPRYALDASFARLLAGLARGSAGEGEIQEWQKNHLSPEALSRVALLKAGAAAGESGARLPISFPNGETRLMLNGPSAVLSKAVIELFAPRFLQRPAVLFLSDSGEKVVARDDLLARSLGLKIEADKNLPDIILVDIASAAVKVVFVEVVATDGAVTKLRREALASIATSANFAATSLYFVTAFRDRSCAEFKKLVSELAWNSYAWLASEPQSLIHLQAEGCLHVQRL